MNKIVKNIKRYLFHHEIPFFNETLTDFGLGKSEKID